MQQPVQTTFAWIKPDVVAAGREREMLDAIRAAGFEISLQRRMRMTRELAEEFYAEHRGKPFFEGLVDFMTSGDAVALALRGPGAVPAWRIALGPTSSERARAEAPGSMRARFGTDGSRNAGHGSDSAESAARELRLVFGAEW